MSDKNKQTSSVSTDSTSADEVVETETTEAESSEDTLTPPAEKSYHIVNPRGAIHVVTREHAASRLRQAGWRLATKQEIAKLARQKGRQLHDKPICTPWSPDPEQQIVELD
ncbi:MAG: hypothetical protein GFH27_549283n412 [Chloroflexi bacterium AL-W]|nr:hypothetical protein [Chloroflexi bacterium AL-N1]NOK64467.1 hypothetical protein [Chloroflexi bacterium AL-N10]NOK75709.1 hypothetical protein [Chloroflexi bacterium AL-N5]NOK80533.1 hypothetical protein [Chloroflexi bacterium AL-W]NOK87047.1 hypothetical protein [Chloroflexi bacterium AL-N15]